MSRIALLVVVVAVAGCGIRFMRKAEGENPLAGPPSGMALVNFLRPSSWGGGVDLPVFDGEKLIGNTKGSTRFQYVCEPGKHHFITHGEHVTVVEAELLADKVYDIVIDIKPGVWKASVSIDPMTRASERRSRVPEFESNSRLLIFNRDEKAIKHEQRARPKIAEIKADFLGGEKADRVKYLAAGDHR